MLSEAAAYRQSLRAVLFAAVALGVAGCRGMEGPRPPALPSLLSVRPAPAPAMSDVPPPPAVPPPGTGLCSPAKDLPDLAAPRLDRKPAGPSQSNLKAWVETLSDPSLRGRAGGSVETKRVAALLAREFAVAGGIPPFPEGNHCQPFSLGGISDQNVVAHFSIKPPDPNPSPGKNPTPVANPSPDVRPVVIVGAHYDSQGIDGEGAVYPGADDNASGVAALMEIARLAGLGKVTTQHDLVLIAFGAEERGALGAEAFVAKPTIALGRAALMINLDMVGRQLLDGLAVRVLLGSPSDALGYVVSDRGRTRSEALVGEAEDHTDVNLIGIPESVLLKLGFLSDSVPFSTHVPTLFLSTSIHHDYHQPSDTAEKVDAGQIERAVRVVLAVIEKT
jgi:hypothetical protein